MRLSTRRLAIITILALVLTPFRVRAQVQPRLSDLLAAGDRAWSATKYDEALQVYRDVLRRDSTSLRAMFRVATLLAWRNEFDRSILLFRQYLRLVPGEADGHIALARALAWSGRYEQSLAICDSVIHEHSENREAALLGAQVLAWSGDLQASAARYGRWLSDHPNDAEARTALQRTEVALAPSFEPAISSSNDSDHNRSTTYVLRTGLAVPWRARVLVDASYRSADLNVVHGSSAALRASSSWTPFGASWTVRGELGAAQLTGRAAPGTASVSRTKPWLGARLFGHPSRRLVIGAGVTHVPFDETAPLIAAGLASTDLEGDAEISLRPRLSLGGSGAWTRLSGGSAPNSRVAGSGTLRWSLTRALSVAAGARAFSYDRGASDGYFAPKRYVLAEGSARLHLGGELGWALESELGLGNQHITAFDDASDGRFSQRYSIAAAYRPLPGIEWGVAGSFANVASPTTISSGDYRAYNISVKGRVRL